MASEQGDDTQQRSYSYSRKKLYFAAFVAGLVYVGVGIFMAWPTPALALLKSRHYESYQYSLVASIPGLAPGPLITTFGISLIGRKYTLFTIWLTLMSSWVIIFISDDIYALLTARFIGGWGMGAAFSAIGIYTSEISDVAVRGPLNSASTVMFSLGGIITNSTGPFISLTALTIISAAFTFLFIIFFWFIPESPYYLVNKRQKNKALSALLWLRHNANKNDVEEELNRIENFIEEEKKDKGGFKKLITSKVVFRQFAVAWYLLFIQQLCGLSPVSSYALLIFEEANLKFSPAYVPIALSAFSIFAGMPTPFLVKKFGNKILFITSTLGCSIGHAILGAYFLCLDGGYDISSFTWAPILGNFILFISVYIGLAGPVWAVVSDLFANSVKGYAVGICGIFSTFLGFVITTVFGLSKEAFNLGPTFLGFSIALLFSVIGLFFIPNLTHMTLQEIQDYFNESTKPSKKEEIVL